MKPHKAPVIATQEGGVGRGEDTRLSFIGSYTCLSSPPPLVSLTLLDPHLGLFIKLLYAQLLCSTPRISFAVATCQSLVVTPTQMLGQLPKAIREFWRLQVISGD
ncbi:unnamed protein product [Hymenolepis diminuta]|uniref:Uncharacterized protein n=1 Tax=Hymenolepis diminuta TaxID=6216 RepID=A0A564Y4X3_HYMDI|nr:unnamed protein product [Hymenolepis diminuta]VUZ42281.1 unnamed protein product [Hymenolepis diminuta]VUZ48055.1 unnamed protein product [Hymenolepis diminuta]